MVTKIGRKSAKCEVQFFNITADLTFKMQKVWSTAWSFVDDSPIEEQIPFKVHMKPEELRKFYIISDFFNLADEDQIAWNHIIGNTTANKHLGLTCTLGADTSAAWKKTIGKMREKISSLNIYKMHLTAQRKCFNMLVGTIPTFASVQMNFPTQELLNFDRYAATFFLKSNGLSKSDSKLRMFLPAEMGGLGLLSTMELDLISVAREFEIVSNNITLDSRAFRTRITALDNYPLHDIFFNKNHARDAIAKLAKYGIYIRDSTEEEVNWILSKISSTNNLYRSCTHPEYKDGCNIGIGLGKEKNKELMYGGPTHTILQLLQENNWKSSKSIILAAKTFRISVRKLLSFHSEFLEVKNKGFDAFLSVWEWRNKSFKKLQTIPKNCEKWKLYHGALEKKSHTQSLKEYRRKSVKSLEFLWTHHVRLLTSSNNLAFNLYSWEGQFLEFLMQSKSPIILATDGAHGENINSALKTTSSFVLSVLDIREGETLASRQWETRTVIPLMSRVSILPENFGNSTTDIAHGEFCAFIMAEMALTTLPRITITDSKAIREQMLKIRNLKNDITDRYYIRSVAGGVGKFISGIMKNLLFQSDQMRTNESRINNAVGKIHDELQARNLSFLNIVETWIADVTREKDEEPIGWEKQYFDKHPIKPILKVNSHQLDPTGTHIKSPHRYTTLIPNLAMLNANHHADVCADYGKIFPHAPFQFNDPPSHLRFFLTCGGKHIDRHISDFCHEQFNFLKVRKLRLKKTQGLLWRIIHSTTTSWEILGLYKGWLRSLLGLTSTHTRRIYKSEIYRECCKKVFFQVHKNNASKTEEMKQANLSTTLTMLSGCMWCKSKPNLECKSRGNRNHALLVCENKDLKSFRIKSTNLIESKLRLFFLELMRATSIQNVEDCLEELGMAFLRMQTQNLGRLRPVEREHNNRYLSLTDILTNEGLISIQDALNSSNFNFCCQIFGLLPNSNGMEIQDDQIGLVDCPWLGLMPICIDKIIRTRCNNICTFVMHKETASFLTTNLQESWKEIKNLIMGRAIVAHRIVCSTGRRIEKEWRKEFEIDINSIKKLKEDIKTATNSNSNTLCFSKAVGKRTYETCRGIAVKREQKKRKVNPSCPTDSLFKSCNGITCDRKCKMWYPQSNFSINQIKSTTKQCQRCSRHMTAIRKSKHILMDIAKESTFERTSSLLQFFQSNCSNMQYNYSHIVNKLKKHLLPSSSSRAILEANDQKKVSDGLKTVCNILCISLQKATNNFTYINPKSIQIASSHLSTALSRKESDFTLDREAETKIKLLISNNIDVPCDKQLKGEQLPTNENKNLSNTTHAQLDLECKPNPVKSLKLSHNDPPKTKITSEIQSSKINETKNLKGTIQLAFNTKPSTQIVADASKGRPKLQEFAARIIRPSRYMLGIEMTKAIEVIRAFKTPNLFIASAEATNQINSWCLNEDWTRFARIFGSRQLINRKLNGTYLIPMFSGDTTSGHWFLCVIRKLRQRSMQAWCVDSLGKGNVNPTVRTKIETAFAPGRAKLTWQHCHCRCQEELECGPRTVLAMWIIQQNLANEVTIEESIQKATLQHAPYHSYSPAMIREKVAFLVNNFTPSMITPPIRLRNRTINNRNRTSPKTKKAISKSDHSCVTID